MGNLCRYSGLLQNHETILSTVLAFDCTRIEAVYNTLLKFSSTTWVSSLIPLPVSLQFSLQSSIRLSSVVFLVWKFMDVVYGVSIEEAIYTSSNGTNIFQVYFSDLCFVRIINNCFTLNSLLQNCIKRINLYKKITEHICFVLDLLVYIIRIYVQLIGQRQKVTKLT